jgi:hypothetical protein
MITRFRHLSRLYGTALSLFALATPGVFLPSPTALADVITQVYSFETVDGNSRPDGFGPNSGGIFSQDTIGTTSGEHSIKVSYPAGPGFSGMLTELLPDGLGDPPGVDYVLFDLTLTQVIAPEAFVDIGVVIFGRSQPGPGEFFGQAQFDDIEQIGNLEVGTHTDLRIDLDSAFHPGTFEPGNFNDIFGTEGSGPDDMIPTGFQLYFNYTAGNMFPFTLYIDNIRTGRITEGGLAGDYNDDGFVDAADYTVWRNHVGDETEDAISNNGDGIGGIDTDDYLWWKQHYGDGGMGVGGGGLSSQVVPEPASAVLLLVALICSRGARRGQATFWNRSFM